MRVSTTPKRNKNRNNGSRRHSNISSNNYQGNGKDTKIKGNAIQVHEKYQSLARDAISSGDIIKAEYYYQHAEHYHRVHKTSLSNINEKNNRKQKDIKINKDNEEIIDTKDNKDIAKLESNEINSENNIELK